MKATVEFLFLTIRVIQEVKVAFRRPTILRMLQKSLSIKKEKEDKLGRKNKLD